MEYIYSIFWALLGVAIAIGPYLFARAVSKRRTATACAVDLNPGERYSGPVLDENGLVQHHLILLPARPDVRKNWDDAKAWATSVGGDLPSPQEQALLFANCRDALPKAWCWSNKEHEEDASYAWLCDFYDGGQSDSRKSYEGSAVAVRRLIP